MKMMFSLFDTLLEPVFVLNLSQKVVYCNEPAALLTGQTVRKLCRDQIFSNLFEFSEPLEFLKRLDQITEATPYKELQFKTEAVPDGKAQITIQPIFDAIGDKNWIVFLRDVTLEERLQKKYRAELSGKEEVIKKLEVAQDQLQDYNKNLEQKVAERTSEVLKMNATLAALLDSLDQGFFIFDTNGEISSIYSKACLKILGDTPAQKMIWDVLKVPEPKVESFKKWMLTLFQEMLPFDDLAPLGPVSLSQVPGQHVSLEYYPLRDENQKITGVVTVASDITSLIEAQEQAAAQKEYALMIINMIKSKREVQRFIDEAHHSLDFLKQRHSSDLLQTADEVYRHLHTLKGGASIFSVRELVTCCHEAESSLSHYRNNPTEDSYQKFSDKLQLVFLSCESFVTKTQEILGKNALSTERQIEIELGRLNTLARKMGRLPVAGPLAEQILLELAMEPASQFLQPYNEALQQIAKKLEKNIAPLMILGGDVMLMPEVYNKLFATLVHAFRNSVDHGIETPEVRQKKGKSPQGLIQVQIEIQVSLQSRSLLIVIEDDGAGIDVQDIKSKLKSQGKNTNGMTDEELLQVVFSNDFTLRDTVGELSGRGVGLNAVATSVAELNGRVWIESTPLQGCKLSICVPYLTEIATEEIFSKAA